MRRIDHDDAWQQRRRRHGVGWSLRVALSVKGSLHCDRTGFPHCGTRDCSSRRRRRQPGTYGSLAAVPQQEPGWSATTIFYHYALSAGADVARAREFDIGGIPANVTANVNANLNVNLNLEWLS